MWQGSVSSVNPSVNPVVGAELQAGEKLLWSGQPRSGIRFRSSDIFLIPFSLMWGGFAIFWEVMALTMFFANSPVKNVAPLALRLIFPLWGIPFVLVGLYLIFGRFLVDAKIREGTFYALTDRRVFIVSTWFGHKIQSINLRQLPEVSLSQSVDGSGTITFGSAGALAFGVNGSWPGSRRYQAPSFEMVDNVRQVYGLIQSAQQQAI